MPRSELYTVDALLPPDEFIRRLEADATDWQESRFSKAARDAGMYAFGFRLVGNRFHMRPRMNNRGLYSPVYEGVVTPTATGSRVSGIFRHARTSLVLIALLYCAAMSMTGGFVVAVWRSGGSRNDIVIASFVMASVLAAWALWSGFVLRHAWRSGELAREETRALLIRVARSSR